MRRAAVLLLVLIGAASENPPTGAFQTTWPLPDDATYSRQYTALGARHGFKIPANYPQEIRAKNQTRKDPTYNLYVPASYRAAEKNVGLIVWISPGETGGVPRPQWTKTLDHHKLIWIGPNEVGNSHDTLWRTYMAIEAVRVAKEHYSIDDTRIYVAGLSGGGRISSHAAVIAPDTFTGGGFYIVGCDYWRDIPVVPGDNAGKYYRGFWRKPDPNLVRKAKKRRYVLLTGDNDMNLANTKAVLDGYQKDKFEHVSYMQVPGMGHTSPDAEWFEKAIGFLEERDETSRGKTSRPTSRLKPAPTTRPSGKIIVGPG